MKLAGKILILRFTRLDRIPPGLYGRQILEEHRFPTVLYEFGNYFLPLPSKLRSTFVFAGALLGLVVRMLILGKPALIIAHDLQEQILALYLHRWFGVKYVIHAHEVYGGELAGAFRRCLLKKEGEAFRAAEFSIFPTRQRAAWYRERHQIKHPIEIVYNCPRRETRNPEPADLRREFGLPLSSKIVIYVGGLGPLNALEEAIDAVAGLPDVVLLLAGWGERKYLAELDKKIATAGVAARVRRVGFIPHEKKRGFLAGADIAYCLYRPTEWRTQSIVTASNKTTEAIAAGVPVLLAAQPEAEAFLKEFPVGATVAIDSASIAAGIGKLLENPESVRRRKEVCRQTHLQTLNYDVQFAAVIQRLSSLFSPASP